MHNELPEFLYTVSTLTDNYAVITSKQTLTIPYELWKKGYDYDVSAYVERNVFKESTQKGEKKEIKYLSWAHAYRIFKQLHPTLNVGFVYDNDLTPVLKQEIGNKEGIPIYSYYCLGYIYNPEGYTTSLTYYPFMNTSNGPLLSIDCDKAGLPTANAVRFNVNLMRALTKIIAIHTGIGLKLWTDEDLDPAIMERKLQILDKIEERYVEYLSLLKNGLDTFKDDIEIIRRDTTMLSQDQLVNYGKKLNRLINQLQTNN